MTVILAALGLASTAVGTPMELVKCRLQVQGSSGGAMQYVLLAIPHVLRGRVACIALHVGYQKKSGVARAFDRYTGAIDCVRQTLTKRGIAGLYCGQAIMCVREPVAFGVYFGCYDAVKRYVCASTVQMSGRSAYSLVMLHVLCSGLCAATGLDDNSAAVQCTAGAATGMATWLTVCPVDVVKSRIQCRPVEIRTGTLATVREMLAEVLRIIILYGFAH